MNKLARLLVATAILAATGAASYAAQSYGGIIANITQVASAAISLGQKAMSASLPVVLASDQSILGVNIAQVGTAAVTLAQKTMANSIPVVFASDQSALPVTPATSAAATISRVSATTTSGQLLAANASRKGIECETACTNADRIFLNFGASAATNQHKPIEACSSWQPPVTPTQAMQVLANSGTQVITCTEY